jgi:hypothetical protein
MMIVFDYSAIRARMERRPVLIDDKTAADCIARWDNAMNFRASKDERVTIVRNITINVDHGISADARRGYRRQITSAFKS